MAQVLGSPSYFRGLNSKYVYTFMEEIMSFSGSLSKICCTKLDLLQDIRKFYGKVSDVHVFLKSERRHQSVAFNSVATQ